MANEDHTNKAFDTSKHKHPTPDHDEKALHDKHADPFAGRVDTRAGWGPRSTSWIKGPDGRIFEIVPVVSKGIPGCRISNSTDPADRWLPGIAEATRRILRTVYKGKGPVLVLKLKPKP